MTEASKWAKRGDCGAKGSDRAAFYVHRHIPGFLKGWIRMQHPLVVETRDIAVAHGVGGRRRRRRNREAEALAMAGLANWQVALAVHDRAMAVAVLDRPSVRGCVRDPAFQAVRGWQRAAFARLPMVARRRIAAMGPAGRSPEHLRWEFWNIFSARLRRDDGNAEAADLALLDTLAARALRSDHDIIGHVLTVASGASAIGAPSTELGEAMAAGRTAP